MSAGLWLLLGLLPLPQAVVITTSAGERRVPVLADAAGPMVPAAPLLAALGGSSRTDGAWAEVRVGPAAFRFLVDAPVYLSASRPFPLTVPAVMRRDSLFLPFQFVTEILPRQQAQRFRWNGPGARLVDLGAPRGMAPAPAPPTAPAARARPHRVTLDPGHGGVDPGNPGLYFPSGMREKDVTLAVGKLLREELVRRGVEVTMTRTADTLIDLRHRGRYCTENCDLFVSLHVNALPRRSGYTAVRGFETYFLAEARTEDAARVAQMENEAMRFEQPAESEQAGGGLDFILKDLQVNEHLRESARAAELVQSHLDRVHDGPNRGVKQAGFAVLATARRPAILVELGYSTNRVDARLLVARDSQRRLASALADAIMRYLADYDRKTGTFTESGAAGW